MPSVEDVNGVAAKQNLAIRAPPVHPTRCLQFLERLKENEDTTAKDLQAKVKLQVVVVGAGLGGLACAIALARRGHGVIVLEQASELGEVASTCVIVKKYAHDFQVGAGIQIPSNSARLLRSWGLGPFLEPYVVEPNGMRFRRWENGDVIGYTKLVPDFRDNFKAPYYVVHRAHFHTALYQRALELGVQVKVASRVDDYDIDTPSVTLGTGEVFTTDLIVAADGVIFPQK